MSFRTANIWQKIDNSKSSSVKFRQKVVFFEEGTRIGRVGVVVWCVCRPSSRLCVSMLRSSFASNATLIFDIRPIIRHLHTTSFFSSSLTYGLLFHGLLFHSFLSITSFRARGGLRGGVTQRVIRGKRRGGEKGWGRGRRSPCTSSHGFRPNFDVFFDGFVNESEKFPKKSFSIFWFLTFFAIYLHRG